MNFARKLVNRFTGLVEEPTLQVEPEAEAPAQDRLNNVVQLPQRNPLDEPSGMDKQPAEPEAPPRKRNGLLMEGLIQNFMQTSHYGFGQHDGAHLKTHQGLEMGKNTLIARFQTLLAQISAQKQASIDSLQNMKLQTMGICVTTTEQLELGVQRLQRDIATLQSQVELAARGQGWVAKALHEYQMGYAAGLRLAVDAELLAL